MITAEASVSSCKIDTITPLWHRISAEGLSGQVPGPAALPQVPDTGLIVDWVKG
jgi:hypothetical protein